MYGKVIKIIKSTENFNLFRWSYSWFLTDGDGKKAPYLKSVTYSTMMKLGTVIPYLKNIQKNKYINLVTNPLSSADIRFFSPEISILIHNFYFSTF